MAKRKLELHYDASGIDEKLLNKKAKGIRYIGKRKFNKAADKGMQYIFVGKTSLKKAYKDDEEALIFDDHEYRIAEPKFSKFTKVGGYIPVGDKRYLEYRKRPLILIILLLLLLLGCAGGAAWYFWPETPDYTVIAPDYLNTEEDANQEALDESEKVKGLVVYITLPDGEITFDGKLMKPDFEFAQMDAETMPDTAMYSGDAHIKTYIQKDNKSYLIIDSDEELRDGQFGQLALDYSIQKTELSVGFYQGQMDIAYSDGAVVTKPVTVVIRNKFGGTMDIAFSPKADVYLSSGNIAVKYKSGYLATHDTILQLILDRDGQEFLLGQSGIVSPGHTLSQLSLIPEMRDRLSPGTYTGRLRFNFYNDKSEHGTVGVDTDIEVEIIVH